MLVLTSLSLTSLATPLSVASRPPLSLFPSRSDWCVRGGLDRTGDCVLNNFLGLFDYDVGGVPDDDLDILGMVDRMDSVSPVETVLGGVRRDDDGMVTGADR